MSIWNSLRNSNFFPLGIVICCLMGFTSCTNEDDEFAPHSEVKKVYFQNTPLAGSQDSLRVLAIGNSYTYDGTAYISEIMDSAFVSPSRYCVCLLAKGNTSLKYWANELTSGEEHSLYRIAGKLRMPTVKATMKELLAQPWDVIVMQQISKEAIDYNTYNPSLQTLIDAIRDNCKNPQVTLAWQLIHAYGKNSSNNGQYIGYDRWEKIANATQIMAETDGINIIIPTGTAIQQARYSELETPYDLTRDNTHLCYGIGRYIAACCWVETLFGPTFGISIKNNGANHPIQEEELNDTTKFFIPSSCSPVTDQNREQCQQCALNACENPYSIVPLLRTTSVEGVKQ